MAAKGRPTTFNERQFNNLLQEVRRSGSVRESCDRLGLHRRTVYRWMTANPELARKILYARVAAATAKLDAAND
jgi:predicted site-specific integrase-resolvase